LSRSHSVIILSSEKTTRVCLSSYSRMKKKTVVSLPMERRRRSPHISTSSFSLRWQTFSIEHNAHCIIVVFLLSRTISLLLMFPLFSSFHSFSGLQCFQISPSVHFPSPVLVRRRCCCKIRWGCRANKLSDRSRRHRAVLECVCPTGIMARDQCRYLSIADHRKVS
jgi:hypothetical protein